MSKIFLRYIFPNPNELLWDITTSDLLKMFTARAKANFPNQYSKGCARLCCVEFHFMDPSLGFCLFVNSDSNTRVLRSIPHTLSPYVEGCQSDISSVSFFHMCQYLVAQIAKCIYCDRVCSPGHHILSLLMSYIYGHKLNFISSRDLVTVPRTEVASVHKYSTGWMNLSILATGADQSFSDQCLHF